MDVEHTRKSAPAAAGAPPLDDGWFRVILDSVPALIAYVDSDQRYRFNNRPYEQWFGLPAAELVGRHLRDVLGEEGYRHRAPHVLAALRGEAVTFEGPVWDGRGNLRDAEISYVPHVTDGVVQGFFVHVQDISKRKRAERALRESEERFRLMADAAPVLVWVAGADGLCTYFNRGWIEFTGRTMEQELGNGWTEGVHPDDLADCMATYTSALQAREPFRMEYRLRRADGEYRWLLDQARPRLTPDGHFAGYIGSCIDITEQKRVERELLRSHERLRSLASESSLAQERERRRMATVLYESIGQTLAMAGMKLGVLEQSHDHGRALSLMEVHDLVEQALRHARALTVELSPPVLYELGLKAALEWLAEQTEREVAIDVAVEDDGQPKQVDEDLAILLFQAARELLLNVIKHAGAERCTIRLERLDGRIRVVVQDDGGGIGGGDPFDVAEPPRAHGLFSFRERLRHAGGDLIFEPDSRGGTTVVMVAPLRSA